jgi:uncharacterized protein (DUF427 family)
MSELKEAKPKTIKIPGPDHPITIERSGNRIMVKVAGRIVADSRGALTLREASYAPVQYIPRRDVDMTLLERTDHATYCPYKGDCSYFSIPSGGVPPTPCGPTKRRMRRYRRSRTMSPFTPTASTRSKSDAETSGTFNSSCEESGVAAVRTQISDEGGALLRECL